MTIDRCEDCGCGYYLSAETCSGCGSILLLETEPRLDTTSITASSSVPFVTDVVQKQPVASQMKGERMDDKTLFGFPVVVSKQVPEGEVVFGRWPSPEEIREHGSFENAIKAQAKQWAIIKGVSFNSED